MIKAIALLLSAAGTMLTISRESCSKQPAACYKARLEIKGMCYNYTFKLLEGNLDTALILSKWTDENTGKTYSNVFGLATPCSFPDSIKQGDEFYFVVDTIPKNICNVCLAYYPSPSRKLPIKVLPAGCQE